MLNLNAVMGVIADVPAVVVSFILMIGITISLMMPLRLDLHGNVLSTSSIAHRFLTLSPYRLDCCLPCCSPFDEPWFLGSEPRGFFVRQHFLFLTPCAFYSCLSTSLALRPTSNSVRLTTRPYIDPVSFAPSKDQGGRFQVRPLLSFTFHMLSTCSARVIALEGCPPYTNVHYYGLNR